MDVNSAPGAGAEVKIAVPLNASLDQKPTTHPKP